MANVLVLFIGVSKRDPIAKCLIAQEGETSLLHGEDSNVRRRMLSLVLPPGP